MQILDAIHCIAMTNYFSNFAYARFRFHLAQEVAKSDNRLVQGGGVVVGHYFRAEQPLRLPAAMYQQDEPLSIFRNIFFC